jgi:hypothetical protein
MNLNQLLGDHANQIIDTACDAMTRTNATHYKEAGSERVHQWIETLYLLAKRGIAERNIGPMIAHVEHIAQERFNSGYDLGEVQTAFNVLEETIWGHILKNLPSSEYAEALGLVSTALGIGKDTLARRYVSLASKAKAPSLNLEALFKGAE